MNPIRITLFGILACGLLFSSFHNTSATLWDLLIDVNLENNPISEGDTPVVIGKVYDHAGKPVSEAEVKIRLGQDAIITYTNSTGNFLAEFTDFDEIPGSYIVNVYATSEESIGLKSINFQVKGETSVLSQTQKILSTPEAVRYLHATVEDFEKDPLGLKLYYHYQYLQTQFIEEQKKQLELIKEQQLLDEQRQLSINITKQILQEENPGAGIFSGYKYDVFVSSLDGTVKEIIVQQLNYTLDVFYKAQKAMNEVLANGGTMEEARKAYFEKASISRELMDELTQINQTEKLENSTNTDVKTISEISNNGTENSLEGLENSLVINVNGTLIDVGKSGSVIYLNVNGTIIKLYVNGTQISQIVNSTQ